MKIKLILLLIVIITIMSCSTKKYPKPPCPDPIIQTNKKNLSYGNFFIECNTLFSKIK